LAAGPHAVFFQGILDKINTTDWSWRKDFLIRRRRFGKKIYVTMGQQLKKLYIGEFNKMKCTPAEQKYFVALTYATAHGQWETKMVFAEPWRFKLKVFPNWIDKVRKRDALLEQRLQEIHNYVTRNGFKGKIRKLIDGGDRWNRHLKATRRERASRKRAWLRLLATMPIDH
jgi:hypothetical protein